MYEQLIQNFTEGGEAIKAAVAGLTEQELHAAPVPGKWSTHHVVIHLLDAEIAFADRIRRVIAMDNPPLLAWDENRYSDRLQYQHQSAADAITLIDLLRKQTARILQSLPESAWARAGQHDQRGPQTLQAIVSFDISHLNHHLKFILEKRKALGK